MNRRARTDSLDRWLIGLGLVIFVALWAGIPYLFSRGYESGWLDLVGLVVGALTAVVVVGTLRAALDDAFSSDSQPAPSTAGSTRPPESRTPPPSRRSIRNWIHAGAPDSDKFWTTGGVGWDFDQAPPVPDRPTPKRDSSAGRKNRSKSNEAARRAHHERLTQVRHLHEEGRYTFSHLLELEELSRVELEWDLSTTSRDSTSLDELRKLFTLRQKGDISEAEWITLKHRTLNPNESTGTPKTIQATSPRRDRQRHTEGRY